MCGRFANAGSNGHTLHIFRKLGMRPPNMLPRYNIAPAQSAPVILRERGAPPVCGHLRWGLVPSWAEDASAGAGAVNARAETIARKPTFRDAFARRRCLIPADGFYEWKRDPDGRSKTPFYFAPSRDGEGLAFAGLWERWEGDGGEIRSFAIITTTANATMRPVHDRMPIPLHPAHWAAWLDPENPDREGLAALLRPPPDDALTSWRVDRYVNSPGNEGEKCIRPARAPKGERTGSLFGGFAEETGAERTDIGIQTPLNERSET